MTILDAQFFARDTARVAQKLLGKIIRYKHPDYNLILSVRIVETECYYLDDKASHSYVGKTARNKAMFMAPGTIYIYTIHTWDALNITSYDPARYPGGGCAVLIKSGVPFVDKLSPVSHIKVMQKLNRQKNGTLRSASKLCSGQGLLYRSLGISKSHWSGKKFSRGKFYIEDVGYEVKEFGVHPRIGINAKRDAHLLYRFRDESVD